MDRISPSSVAAFAEHIRTHAIHRRNSRDGRSAAEHAVAAMGCLFRHARLDGHTTTNPAALIPKPRRHRGHRSALQAERLQQIHQVAATTGNDPDLDALLLRLHTETARRRAEPSTSAPETSTLTNA